MTWGGQCALVLTRHCHSLIHKVDSLRTPENSGYFELVRSGEVTLYHIMPELRECSGLHRVDHGCGYTAFHSK